MAIRAIVRRVLVVAILGLAVFLVVQRLSERRVVVQSSAGVTPARTDRSAPAARRPVPESPGFEGCPGVGDGGDRDLNRLKNRVDTAFWVPTPFASVLGLDWPAGVVRRSRAAWSRSDTRRVAASEGLPVAVEGYFVGAKVEGPEATNCHGAESKFRDWHLWLAASPGKDRRRSIVVETTPVIRASHPEWKLGVIRRLVRDSTLVRVSGWLMLDPEHPDQLRKTRGTLWEIHPVMRIEVRREGTWSELPRD
jgi:hypothetical protein